MSLTACNVAVPRQGRAMVLGNTTQRFINRDVLLKRQRMHLIKETSPLRHIPDAPARPAEVVILNSLM